MRALLLFISLVLLVLSPSMAYTETAADMEKQNRLLESEIELAKGKSIYALFDLDAGLIHLKAKGIDLKVLSAAGIKLSGKELPSKPLSLTGKKAFVSPRRELLKPEADNGDSGAVSNAASDTNSSAASNTDPYDIKAFEVADMPSTYSLLLEDNVTVFVVPEAASLVGRAKKLFSLTRVFFLKTYGSLRHALKGTQHSEVKLVLSEADAKALYWHMGEGTKSLFITP